MTQVETAGRETKKTIKEGEDWLKLHFLFCLVAFNSFIKMVYLLKLKLFDNISLYFFHSWTK